MRDLQLSARRGFTNLLPRFRTALRMPPTTPRARQAVCGADKAAGVRGDRGTPCLQRGAATPHRPTAPQRGAVPGDEAHFSSRCPPGVRNHPAVTAGGAVVPTPSCPVGSVGSDGVTRRGHVGSSCAAALCGTMWQSVRGARGGGGRAVPLPPADAASAPGPTECGAVQGTMLRSAPSAGGRGDKAPIRRLCGAEPWAASTRRGFGATDGVGAVRR